MATKKTTREKNGGKRSSSVIALGPRRVERESSPVDELRHLIGEVRACAQSAENLLLRCDPAALAASEHAQHWDPIEKPTEATERELARMRRMLVAWERVGLEDGNDLHARMHFTAGVQFHADIMKPEGQATEGRRRALQRYAAMLVAKIRSLYPAQAKRLDVALVAQAIDRRSRGRWDWKIMVAAWGNDTVDSVQWPIRWNEWRKTKGGTPIET